MPRIFPTRIRIPVTSELFRPYSVHTYSAKFFGPRIDPFLLKVRHWLCTTTVLEYRIIDNYSYEQYEGAFGIPATHKHHDQFLSSYLSISSTRHDLPSFSTVQPLLSTSSSLYLFSPATTYLLRLPIPSLVPVLHSLFPINYSSYRRKRSRDCLALPQYPFSSQSVVFHGSTQHSYHCLCTRVLLIITPQFFPSHPSIPSIQMALTDIRVHPKRYPEHFFLYPIGRPNPHTRVVHF